VKAMRNVAFRRIRRWERLDECDFNDAVLYGPTS
jgi:hypothetical protein